jgi:hypothetical protein
MKQEREKKFTYGPRDVNDIPWALFCGGDRGRRLRRDEELWEEGGRETSRMVEVSGKDSLFVCKHCLGMYCLIWKCQCGEELGQLKNDRADHMTVTRRARKLYAKPVIYVRLIT